MLPLNDVQRRALGDNDIVLSGATDNATVAVRVAGEIDVGVLEAALRLVAERRTVLRTRVADRDGDLVQEIGDDVAIEVSVADARAPGRLDDATWFAAREAARPIDVRVEAPCRLAIGRCADGGHAVVVTGSRVQFDDASLAQLLVDAGRVYRARLDGSAEPELDEGADDHLAMGSAAWDRAAVDAARRFWSGRLEGVQPVDLPVDSDQAPSPVRRASVVARDVPADALQTWRASSLWSTHGGDAFVGAVVALLVHRYASAQKEVPVAAAGIEGWGPRRGGRPAGTYPVRLHVDGDTSLAFLAKEIAALRADVADVLPCETLASDDDDVANALASPAFRHVDGRWVAELERSLGAGIAPLPVARTHATRDVEVVLREWPDHASLELVYDGERFTRARMQRMLEHLVRTLDAGARDADVAAARCGILGDDERARILEWSRTDMTARRADLVSTFEAQASRRPDATALRFGDRTMTYGELDRRSNRLAQVLRRRGVERGRHAAILLERGFDAVVSALAVLKAGGAFVPLDHMLPPKRIAFVVEDTDAAVLVTTSSEAATLDVPADRCLCLDLDGDDVERQPDVRPDVAVAPDDVAYVIYTSGSTGTPKGVVVEHQAAVAFVDTVVELFEMSDADRVLQFAAPTFDVSVFEAFSALLSGATLVLAPRDVIMSPDRLSDLMEASGITVIDMAPAMMARLEPERFEELRICFVGGEAFPGELVNRWNVPGRRFFNGYGPTETTVTSIVYECPHREHHSSPPIGRPLPNEEAYVVDAHGNLVPVGVVGEIVIGGRGLARGYLNRPELTRERFVELSFGDEEPRRVYRTGDLGRWNEDGQIEFLGRADLQVKIRGIRIELEEIEAILGRHPGVRQVAVLAEKSPAGDTALVAYVVPTSRDATKAGDLRTFLGNELPPFMIPARFAFLDAFPLTTSGKVDRDALRGSARVTASSVAGLASSTEAAVAAAFAEVLGVDGVGPEDDFFALGGDSLGIVDVTVLIEQGTGRRISIRDFYRLGTVAAIAAELEDPGVPITPGETYGGLVCVREGASPPLVLVHPSGGSASVYRRLGDALPGAHAIYALEAPGVHDDAAPLDDVGAFVERYAPAIAPLASGFVLGGWSGGAVIASEMAAALIASGVDVPAVVLIEPDFTPWRAAAGADDVHYFVEDVARSQGRRVPAGVAAGATPSGGLDDDVVRALVDEGVLGAESTEILRRRYDVFRGVMHALGRYRGGGVPPGVRAVVIEASEAADPDLSWTRRPARDFERHVVRGDHYSIWTDGLPELAALLGDVMATAARAGRRDSGSRP